MTDPVVPTERAPSSPLKLDARGWLAVLKRTAREFQDDQLTDIAAGLTYYAVLAIFPALIALVSILGLVGDSAITPLEENIRALAPGPAQDILLAAIEQISSSSAAGLGLVLGILGAIWSASGYVGGFARASNRIYEVEEGRPFWKLRPLQIAITVGMIFLLAICAVAVVVTGPLAREVGDVVGAGETAVDVWDVAKWPVIVLVVITMMSVLFWVAPNVRQPAFRWITPGGVTAVVLWVLTSGLFPIGVARTAEPHPGLRVDTGVLLAGGTALVLVTTLSALPAALLGRVLELLSEGYCRPEDVSSDAFERAMSEALEERPA